MLKVVSPGKYLISSKKSIHSQNKLPTICCTSCRPSLDKFNSCCISLLSEIIQEMKTSSCPLNYIPIRHMKDSFNGVTLCSTTYNLTFIQTILIIYKCLLLTLTLLIMEAKISLLAVWLY